MSHRFFPRPLCFLLADLQHSAQRGRSGVICRAHACVCARVFWVMRIAIQRRRTDETKRRRIQKASDIARARTAHHRLQSLRSARAKKKHIFCPPACFWFRPSARLRRPLFFLLLPGCVICPFFLFGVVFCVRRSLCFPILPRRSRSLSLVRSADGEKEKKGSF